MLAKHHYKITFNEKYHWASQVALVVKNLPVNARDPRDAGLIPESGRSPGVGCHFLLYCIAWKIPWTEEPGGIQSMGLQRVGLD